MIVNGIDLRRFAHYECNLFLSGSNPLEGPFIMRGFIYATEGHCAVRMPTNEPNSPDNEKKCRPQIDALPMWSIVPSVYEPIPKVDPPVLRKCEDCGGTGIRGKCGACGGSGEVEFEFCYKTQDYQIYGKCPVCHEKGDGLCYECEGKGFMKCETRVRFQVADFEAWRLVELQHLPGIEGGVVDEFLRFRFDGGDGVLMALRPERKSA